MSGLYFYVQVFQPPMRGWRIFMLRCKVAFRKASLAHVVPSRISKKAGSSSSLPFWYSLLSCNRAGMVGLDLLVCVFAFYRLL